MGGRFPRVMRGRRASLLARGRRVWVSHTCAAGDISRTFASATAAGFPRVRGGRRMARTAPGAGARALSAVCKSPAMCNSDLQRTALRGSKAASSGGRFLRAPRAGPSLWGRQGRGEKSPWDLLLTSCGVLGRRVASPPGGRPGRVARPAGSLRSPPWRPPVPVAAPCGDAARAACAGQRAQDLPRCAMTLRSPRVRGKNRQSIACVCFFLPVPRGAGQRSAERVLCAAGCGGVSRWGSCCRSLRRERARRALGRPFWDGVERFENRGIAVEAARTGCRAVRRRCARRGVREVRGWAAARLRIAALPCLRRGPSLWDGKEEFESRRCSFAGCHAVRRHFARRGVWSERAVNCGYLDFSFPSRRDGPALGRARPVRGELRRCFEMGKLLPVAPQGTRWRAGPSPQGTAWKD